MKDPLTNCTYNKVYKDLKEVSQNGENFCKQLTYILQQRANLEITYAKGLQKLADKLTKALQNTKKNCICGAWTFASESMKSTADLHQKLGKAIQSEAIKPTNQILSAQEKKKRILDNEVDKMANLVINNWSQQIKAKKKLMVETKKHEALFHSVESAKQSVTEKQKRKLLNKLKKSTEKLAKEDESYYQKNIAGYTTRLKWEATLQNCYQNVLDLEKERIQLLCNILNQYNQHVSIFGQTLTTGHTQLHCAISKIDVEKDIKTLMEDTAISTTEEKSEFLLTDYFEEDPENGMDRERRKSSIKSKLSRLQEDIEKASRDKEGLERMLNVYTANPSFSDAKTKKETAVLVDETNLKLDLLQANFFKLSSVLADLEQKPKPTHPCSSCISTWKEKDQTHSSVKISRPFVMKRLENVVTRASSSEPSNKSGSPTLASGITSHGNGTCKALYPFQARGDDELNLEKGDIVTIYEKQNEGWWFGSLKGKKGHFPSAYVEEVPSNDPKSSSEA
ncbi:nostrin isoform X1 [Vombatus ursinus]|uniref:Nostrin n=2 Tax=Vombatus ursinus TaxID=29139 RepID=A0A4X2LRW6_VOMUR|nr:nostrin isoform X1 [Vombatus ursinus]